MTQPPADLPHDAPHVSCAVCGRQIPKSAAQSAEGRDYVMYVCGLDCLDALKRKQNDAKDAGNLDRPPG